MTVAYNNLLRLADLATGTEVGTWGELTDTNICNLLTNAVTGASYVAIAANNTTDQILTALNGQPDQSRAAILAITGTLTVTKNIIIPNSMKLYHVFNWTSGGGAIVIKPAGGSGVTIPTGLSEIVYCDGSNTAAFLAGPLSRYLPLTGGAINGQLVIYDSGLQVQATASSGQALINIKAYYGNQPVLFFGNTHGNRWAVLSNATPEGGSNSGSDFVIGCYNDDSGWLSAPMYIIRSSGQATFNVMPRSPYTAKVPAFDDLVAWRQFQGGYAATDATGLVYVPFGWTMTHLTSVVCQVNAGGPINFHVQIVVLNVTNAGFVAHATESGANAIVGFYWMAFGY